MTFVAVIMLLLVAGILAAALARSAAIADAESEAAAAGIFDRERCACGVQLVAHEVDRGRCDDCVARLCVPLVDEGRWTTRS